MTKLSHNQKGKTVGIAIAVVVVVSAWHKLG